jgi:uncharacterized protein (TIGR03086 family)
MAWRSDEAYLRGLEFMSQVVEQVQLLDWDRASPCAGWTVLDVLGHVGMATRFGSSLLRDEAPMWEPVDPPGAEVEGDPRAWWLSLVEPAREAVREADLERVVDSPMGRRSVAEGLTLPAVDLFVHGWDIGRSAGLVVEIPAEAIEFVHRVIAPIPDEMVRSDRVFGKEVPAPSDASPSEALIAWTGRDPRMARET